MKICLTIIAVVILAFAGFGQTRRKPVKPKTTTLAKSDATAKKPGREWTALAEQDDDVFFYRAADVKEIKKDVVQFWIKKQDKFLDNERRIMTLYQVNCRVLQIRSVHVTAYSFDGSVVADSGSDDDLFMPIEQNTNEEKFAKAACRDYRQN